MKLGENIGQVNDSLADSRLVDEARVLALRAIWVNRDRRKYSLADQPLGCLGRRIRWRGRSMTLKGHRLELCQFGFVHRQHM